MAQLPLPIFAATGYQSVRGMKRMASPPIEGPPMTRVSNFIDPCQRILMMTFFSIDMRRYEQSRGLSSSTLGSRTSPILSYTGCIPLSICSRTWTGMSSTRRTYAGPAPRPAASWARTCRANWLCAATERIPRAIRHAYDKQLQVCARWQLLDLVN
jgi:hypothetical protein